jgi:hypothetical protein
VEKAEKGKKTKKIYVGIPQRKDSDETYQQGKMIFYL